MRRFLNNLLRNVRSTRTTRGGRRAPHRSLLQVEALEARWVPTSVSVAGSSLTINNIAQNHVITIEANSNQQIEVFDGTTLVNASNLPAKSSINSVKIQVSGGDNIIVNDSNGMPFAYNTGITLTGSGSGNLLSLGGSRAISGNELYVAGGASYTPGELQVDNLTFSFNSAIGTVLDSFQITGTFDVQTSGTNVVLSSSFGTTQTLNGMGFGGGDSLTFSNKPSVELETYAANASIALNATTSALLEQSFAVLMHGANESTTITATPSNVPTNVYAYFTPVSTPESVYVRANAAPVYIEGLSASTNVSIGQPLSNGQFSTKGIKANVEVSGAKSVFLSDSGNTSTPENVTVTESSIYGLGLFGNNGVKLTYYGVGTVNLVSGQDVDYYTVAPSQAGARFSSAINITDFSTQFFRADVYIDSGSHLNLHLNNITTQQQAEVFVHPSDNLDVVDSSSYPNGYIDAYFAGTLNSQIDYTGFTLAAVEG